MLKDFFLGDFFGECSHRTASSTGRFGTIVLMRDKSFLPEWQQLQNRPPPRLDLCLAAALRRHLKIKAALRAKVE